MAVIAARKPFNITHFGQALEIDLYIYDFDATKPADPNYTIKKVSFEDGVDETLSINISPFVRDFFDHSGATSDFTIPNGGQQMPANMYLKVDAVVNTVEENHTALDGWLEMGLSTKEGICDFDRPLTGGYVTIKKGSFNTVKYTGFDGTVESYSLSATTNGYLVLKPSLTVVTEPNKTFTMELIGSKTASYTFKVDCPFENDYSYDLGYVNKWGLVEWVGVQGSVARQLNVSSSDFIKAIDKSSKVYNKDGNYSLNVNTGYLSGNTPDFIESIMMSESVWVRSTSQSGKYFENAVNTAIIKSTSTDVKDSRKDKLTNYNFQLELTPSILYG